MRHERNHTCRFCKARAPYRNLIKYATRHYAHAWCYFKAGKLLSDLSINAIVTIDPRTLDAYGLRGAANDYLDQMRALLLNNKNPRFK